jgi:hypothetical protein
MGGDTGNDGGTYGVRFTKGWCLRQGRQNGMA